MSLGFLSLNLPAAAPPWRPGTLIGSLMLTGFWAAWKPDGRARAHCKLVRIQGTSALQALGLARPRSGISLTGSVSSDGPTPSIQSA